jgi:hypothetical protein
MGNIVQGIVIHHHQVCHLASFYAAYFAAQAMAPAYVIAQLCDFVDLDGALFLAGDRSYPMSYGQGVVTGLSSQLWG